ncbi:patatin-like protein [Sphingomonas sp. BGYR3]|uniref:patatin-like protein n=1 Tax=Sphingomonas sp. BGYR3 TaxID=2975483 RepID=UPI0021A8487A|nr:patatin-like protein [Sphingomonas sp. BGYR3]
MREKELRLALVCYGGISLAVYMHGITKEIWRLARASRAFCDGDPPSAGSEGVYRALMQDIADRTGVQVRVLADIVAGASAGGINGVFLAQAISSGQSLDPLTDLWLDTADVEALIDPGQAPSGRMTKLWALPIAWMAMNRGTMIDATVEEGARDEVKRKLEHFVRSRWFEPPFGGERMLDLLLDALDAMAAVPAGPRLLPPGQPIDLFVTVTDFEGHFELLRLNSPPEVIETEHRLVISFRDQGHDGPCPLADPAELAFAARATSSFPGAFPPFSVGELDRVLDMRDRSWPGRAEFLRRAMPHRAAAGAAEQAALIDGSVLVNAPFQPAIDALRERPARRQVDRRFIFIDPTPGARPGIYGEPGHRPGFFQTIIGSLSELPRQQPIRDNLEAIAARSERIIRMRTIMEAIRAEVEAQVVGLFGYTLFLDYPTPRRLVNWRRRAQSHAASRAGYGHAAYALLKVDAIIDRLAALIGAMTKRTTAEDVRAIRAALAACVRERGAMDFAAGHPTGAAPAAVAFLRAHDLGFRIRRLRLLARRITELDEATPDEALSAMREAVYQSLSAYLECERQEHHAGLIGPDDMPALLDHPGVVLDRVAAHMNLEALDSATDDRLSAAFSQLSRDLRRPVLLAYLGFPFFDLATLPLLEGEGMDEFDPIRVDRISPDDATAIRSGGAAATLKGIQFNNFGAFFSRAYRENDYLWGRLHGADRLIDIVLSTLSPSQRPDPAELLAVKQQAFRAILNEERERLKSIPGLFEALDAEIG